MDAVAGFARYSPCLLLHSPAQNGLSQDMFRPIETCIRFWKTVPMPTFEDSFRAALDVALRAASAVPTLVSAVRPLSDDGLLAAQRTLVDARRALDAASSLVAGEILHRSRRELGYEGLAQRTGYRTAEKLVQHTTGSTARDAVTLVRVGALVHDAEALAAGSPEAFAGEPWLTATGAAVATGSLSVEGAQAIRAGLGAPSEVVSVAELAAAVETLIVESVGMHAGRLLLRARELRDELDTAGIADRERQIYRERGIRRVRRANGLSRYIVDTDLESDAYWGDLYDKLTSPRRGGPRFVSEADKAWADAIATDERSVEQYVHDAITELLRIGTRVDVADKTSQVVGSREPSVRVLVTASALETGVGAGRIEGADMPVSIATVERIACSHGTVALAFDDDGQALNVGREQRLFTTRQRVALAARDGGCMFTDCDRPPAWCEAHHVEYWHRDVGKTDIADGILLCRYHHLLVHNNDWTITRDAEGYWLTPPIGADEKQPERRLMRSLSAALRDLMRETA